MNEISEPALVWTGKVMLEGRIAIPANPVAAVIIASAPTLHQDGRDERIAAAAYADGLVALYVPLLTDDELQFDSRTAHYRHDADFLAARLVEIAQWLRRNRETQELPIGFCASAGAAAGAIIAAAQRPDLCASLVAIDARTDLATDQLRDLKVPVLLVVNDMPVLRMNREALLRIRNHKRIEIVHGIDAEAIESVVMKATRWFVESMAAVAA